MAEVGGNESRNSVSEDFQSMLCGGTDPSVGVVGEGFEP